jgi:ABC-type sugar transport system ATPase subunit
MNRARRLISDHGFPLQAEWPVHRLSAAGRQLVEICRAISQGSSLLIFDEPTSSLSENETQEVFRIVESLKVKGLGVIYITHRLEELRRLGDRVTVLRDGETVHQCLMSEITTDTLIHQMVGREVSARYHRESLTPGEVLLHAEKLSNRALRGVSITLRAGEIVGLAGLMGAGRTELCRALFGVDRLNSGEVTVGGQVLRARSPIDAVRAGLALIPEDRQRTGLARLLPILQNTTIASLDRVSRAGWIQRKGEEAVVGSLIGRLRIRAQSPGQLAGRLSGGNQQKVVIAKWLARGAKVFLFDEPTRGIDVAAKAEVFQAMDQLAREGAAILMVSSELPELIQVADRIAVMRGGRIAGELPRTASQQEILRLAAFQESAPAHPAASEPNL